MQPLRLPLKLAHTPIAIAVGVARLALSAARGLVSRDDRRTAPPPPPPVEHVTDEPTVVAAVADPGAEEGAGAEVSVDEPWEGYARMPAATVTARLRGEPAEVAAAVSLYEASHKGRRSVLEGAGRAMRGQPV